MHMGRRFFVLIGGFDANMLWFGFSNGLHTRVISISRVTAHVDRSNFRSQCGSSEGRIFARVEMEQNEDRGEQEQLSQRNRGCV